MYEGILKHVDRNWQRFTFRVKRDQGVRIRLPNAFVAPNDTYFARDQYYWDSYFIILGLLDSGRIQRAKGIVENFAYLIKRFGMVPLSNRMYNTGLSQLPFLTSMIEEVYNATRNRYWLSRMARSATIELNQYWMDRGKELFDYQQHLVYKGLSRYHDHFGIHLTAEHESGWDMTSRFGEMCLNYVPVDLNSNLYKYEKDLSRFFRMTDSRKAKDYEKRAEERKKTMRIMWDSEEGFFFDYDYKNMRRSKFLSLAGYYPLWAGLASKKQAKEARDNLHRFEYGGGLANTQESGLSKEFRQWDYPNGWPGQQWIVVKGLLNYGYKEDALRIARKWLAMNSRVFELTGQMWEKYDVVRLTKGKDGRYPTMPGFGWTFGVFVRMWNTFKENL